jgi:hypothetical protein
VMLGIHFYGVLRESNSRECTATVTHIRRLKRRETVVCPCEYRVSVR